MIVIILLVIIIINSLLKILKVNTWVYNKKSKTIDYYIKIIFRMYDFEYVE